MQCRSSAFYHVEARPPTTRLGLPLPRPRARAGEADGAPRRVGGGTATTSAAS